jgi:hypothetical protein
MRFGIFSLPAYYFNISYLFSSCGDQIFFTIQTWNKMNEWCTLVAHILYPMSLFAASVNARLFSFRWFTMENWNSAPHKNSSLVLWHFTFFYCYYNVFLIWIPFFMDKWEEFLSFSFSLFLTKAKKILLCFIFYFSVTKRSGTSNSIEKTVKNYFSSESASQQVKNVFLLKVYNAFLSTNNYLKI